MMKKMYLMAALSASLFSVSCNKNGTGINLFSLEDDKQLGMQVKEEIASKPAEYPILNRTTHAAAYNYIDAIKQDILSAGKVTYKDEFVWELFIIKDDNTVNAFCTPGGYIYIYTGLIKYLESKSALAGVMGHEMAHADKRHSTEQLTKVYGLETLLAVALGNDQGTLSQIATSLAALSFSRSHETEADTYSVIYLCPTKYEADGSAQFFQKIINQGGGSPPEFLSTHPNPDNRVQNIQDQATTNNCQSSITQQEEITDYNNFKNSI